MAPLARLGVKGVRMTEPAGVWKSVTKLVPASLWRGSCLSLALMEASPRNETQRLPYNLALPVEK